MTWEFNIINNILHVFLTGSMYVSDSNRVKDILISFIDKGHDSFVIDFSKVDYIDSSGRGMLVFINKKVLLKGGSFILKGIHGLTKEVFELTQLDKVIEIQQ